MDDTGAPRDYDGQDPHVRHTPATNGYAKLVGIDFSFILRDKKVMLGRRMPQDRPGVLGISHAKNISRNHAEISYVRTSSTSGYWQCVCSGKNGLQLNEDYRGPNEVVKLQHRDRLQIGDAIFFFLEPFTMSTTLVNTRIQA